MSDTIRCDVAVIGAGIAGAGLAALLAADRRVVVLEAEAQPGHHATGRSAAVFLRNYGGPAVRALTARSEADLTAPPDDWECPSLLSPRGQLLIAPPGSEAMLDAALASDVGLVEIDRDEALARAPVLRRDAFVRAAYEAAARDIDVDRLHGAWLRLLRRRGGKVLTDARADGLKRVDGVWRIAAGALTVTAPLVVNAAGAWADPLAAMAGARRVGLTPLRRSVVVLPAPDGVDLASLPLFGDVAESWYAKPAGGALLVSPADEDAVSPHDAFPDDMVLAEGLDRFERATTIVVRAAPRSWAGLRTFAPDREPVVGFDPAAPGFFWLAGQGGYGIQTAPALSRIAEALIAGASPHDLAEADIRQRCAVRRGDARAGVA